MSDVKLPNTVQYLNCIFIEMKKLLHYTQRSGINFLESLLKKMVSIPNLRKKENILKNILDYTMIKPKFQNQNIITKLLRKF